MSSNKWNPVNGERQTGEGNESHMQAYIEQQKDTRSKVDLQINHWPFSLSLSRSLYPSLYYSSSLSLSRSLSLSLAAWNNPLYD